MTNKGTASEQALEAALNAEYPVPNSPHASVNDRAFNNRSAFVRGWKAHALTQRAAPEAPSGTYPTFQHPDDSAVDRFATAMKMKMAASRAKGRGGWDNEVLCPAPRLQSMLLDHLAKGDPVDVGNFCMMLWNRQAPAAAPATASIGPSKERWMTIGQKESEFDGNIEAGTTTASASSRQTELVELLKVIRPNYGNVGTRDVDVTAQRQRIDRACEILSSFPHDLMSHAQQPAQGASIDTNEFFELLCRLSAEEGSEWTKAYRGIVVHIDARRAAVSTTGAKCAATYCPACERNVTEPCNSADCATPEKPASATDEQIEAQFIVAGGRWDGNQWVIEDADFHPFVRSIDARRAAVSTTGDATKLDKFIDWYLRGGSRREVHEHGHIEQTTREHVLAWLAAAPQSPTEEQS